MDLAKFFDAARDKPFGGSLSQSAVDGIAAILGAFTTYGDGSKPKLAYILATAFHEADRFRTMREHASGEAYEGRPDLGNTQAGDGRRFRGRGFVQITGRRNYTDWGKRLGLDLVGSPELAEQRPIAARILVEGMMLDTFTGKALGDYIGAADVNYRDARRVVNGTDKADLIAGYARQFEAALTAGGFGEAAAAVPAGPSQTVLIPSSLPEPPRAPEPVSPAAPVPAPPPMGHNGGPALVVPEPVLKPNLTPLEQSNKAVKGFQWGALATAIWTAIVAADVLPPAFTTQEMQAAITGLIVTLAAAIGTYQARDKRFQGQA